jgi:hypothetical protein
MKKRTIKKKATRLRKIQKSALIYLTGHHSIWSDAVCENEMRAFIRVFAKGELFE